MDRTDVHVQMLGTVHAHDADSTVFLIYPNKIGFGSLCSPISGGDDACAQKLSLLLQLAWPAGTLMQVALWASPDLTATTSTYRNLRTGTTDPILRQLTEQHCAFMRDGADHPIDPSTGVRLRDTQVAITVQIPLRGPVPTDAEMSKAKELRVGFDAALKAAGLGGVPMTPHRYLRLMETILNQGPESSWRRSPLTDYNPDKVICSQILDPGNTIEVDSKGLWLNGRTRVTVLSPKRYPTMCYFGMAMQYLTDPKQGARGIRENALVTLNLYFPEHERSRARLEKDLMWSTHQASTPIAKYMRYFRDRKDSISAVLNQVENGDRIVQGYLSMAIFTQGQGDDPQSRSRTEEMAVAASINAQGYWREFGFQMMEDRFMVLPFFSQMLPFAVDEGLKQTLERYKTLSGRHAAYLMPVMASWRGTGTPLMTLFARDGQIQPISPWDTDSNMNFLVAASSGAGKSVSMQALLANMRSVGGRCWVIDVGDSYKNLCEILEGQYNEFSPENPICMNPFPLVTNFDEDVDMLTDVVAIMIAPTEGLGDFKKASLKRVMSEVFQSHGASMGIDTLAAALKESPRQEISDMGEQLYPFTTSGAYGRYFNGTNNIDVTNPFTVLELGALKSKPHLQRVVLLTLMYQISQAVYMGDRSQRSMLLVDEAWQLLASDETAEFIERAFRQFRKHNASVGVVTQSVMDVWETKGGRAIAENAAHYYLLKQKGDSIDAIRRGNRLPFGDWGYEMLKSVHTVQGQYSEIMCVTPYGVGIGRLILNDQQKLLFSTKAEDVAAIRDLRKQGLTLRDAVQRLINNLPNISASSVSPSQRKAIR